MPAPPASARGQLVEHMPVHTVTFDIGTVPPPVQYRLYTSLPGPAVAAANTGAIIFGMCWQVLAPGTSLVGYSNWCCKTGQDVNPINFALWRLTGFTVGTLIPAGTVTGGGLTQGAWNDTFLPAPLPLNQGTIYLAQYGLVNGFPATAGYWSSGGVGYDGMTNGPLQAFSDQGASNPIPSSEPQMTFAAGTSDPTSLVAPNGNGSFNAWLDILIATG